MASDFYEDGFSDGIEEAREYEARNAEEDRFNRMSRIGRYAAEMCAFWHPEVGRWDEDCAYAEMLRRHPEMTASEFSFAWARLVDAEASHYKGGVVPKTQDAGHTPWPNPCAKCDDGDLRRCVCTCGCSVFFMGGGMICPSCDVNSARNHCGRPK